MVQRVPTGIEGLDEVIQGGFPKGSMILLGGNPGTGKTIFSGEFLYHGAKEFFENGLYVSLSEGREAFVNNMSSFGLNFEALESEDKIKIMELVTVKEAGLDTLSEMITSCVDTLGIERLVIDPFTAMTNAFEKPIDVRITLHLLSKIVRQTGCTTIVVTEIPTGRQRIGLGIEEFVVDGIIILKKKFLEKRLLRELEITKMRGTRVTETRLPFTLQNGFKVFQPFKTKSVEKRKRFKPVPHRGESFSTGCEEFDQVIGGGLPKGSIVLLEFETETPQAVVDLFTGTIEANFVSQGMGVVLLPSCGENAENIHRTAKELQFTDEEVKRFMRVMSGINPDPKRKTKTSTPRAQSFREKFEEMARLSRELETATGKPVLVILNLDSEVAFGEENFKNMINQIAETTKRGNLLILSSRLEVKEVTQRIASIVNVHARTICENGIPLFYGIRPRTPFYAVEVDPSKGYRLPKLTPIL